MEAVPFQRGQTFFGYAAPDTSTTYNHLMGLEFSFVDDVYGTGRLVWCRVVRNTIGAGLNVFAKSLCVLDATGTKVTGVTNLDAYGSPAVAAGPIALADEKLLSGGVPNNDLFYVVVEGPALALTAMTNAAANVISVGDFVNGQTYNVTSGQVTTGGRIKTRVLSSSVTAAQTESEGIFARAMSSIATSGQTNTSVLVDVFRRL